MFNAPGAVARMTKSWGGSVGNYENGHGQRARKTVTEGTNTYYVYDESGRLLGEYDHNGGADNEMVYLAGLPVLAIRGNATWMVQSDQLGTPRALVGPNGPVGWLWDSDAFGDGLPETDPDGNGKHGTRKRTPTVPEERERKDPGHPGFPSLSDHGGQSGHERRGRQQDVLG